MVPALLATGLMVVVFILLWLIGRWQMARDLRYNEEARRRVVEYHNTFVRYLDSEGRDHEALVALMAASAKIQHHLGFDNVVHNVRVNFTIYNNVPAIPMIIEALQESLAQWGRDRDTYAAANAIRNVLIRHAGRRDDRVQLLLEHADYPLLCIAEGWKVLVALPISFLRAFGLLSEGRAERTKHSFWFKLYSATLFLATVGATAIAYIADREEVNTAIRKVL